MKNWTPVKKFEPPVNHRDTGKSLRGRESDDQIVGNLIFSPQKGKTVFRFIRG